MLPASSIHRRLIALLMLAIACGVSSPCRSVAAQQKDRAPELQELIADLVDVLHVRYHGNVAQRRALYKQVRQAIAKWNASARSDADFELMAGWLRAALQTVKQGTAQPLPPVPTLSTKVSRTPPETPAVHIARKMPETQIVAINLSELHSRIRGTNRELRKVESELSLSADVSAFRLAELAKLLGNLERQHEFLAIYYQSLSKPKQASTPRLLPTDTAIRLLTERVTQLRHTLRRRGSEGSDIDKLLLTEASRLLNELRGE